MATTSRIPVDQLLAQLPAASDIRAQIDDLERQRLALLPLLRAAVRLERQPSRTKTDAVAQREKDQLP